MLEADDLPRRLLITCHPILSMEARVALTLRLVGGLTTEEIARAFLVPEPTIAQRIERAQRALAASAVQVEVPRGEALAERVSSVLAVVYLIFNEGYSATVDDDSMRPRLREEALRLGRMMATLVPEEPEVFGLIALMELNGESLQRGLAALTRAEELGGRDGPYALQAAIAACHARAVTAADTDWHAIAALYAQLESDVPSPVVALERAVAVGMADGPAAGLALADALRDKPSLRGHHLLASVRGDLLEKLGRLEEARAEFERAASLTKNLRARDVLLARAARGKTQ